MNLLPEQFAKAVADATRLRMLVLMTEIGELCVCEFTRALQQSQPKISRHLAILRESGLVMDRREGQWIHYRTHPDLPRWAFDALKSLAEGSLGKEPYVEDMQRVKSVERVSKSVERVSKSGVCAV